MLSWMLLSKLHPRCPQSIPTRDGAWRPCRAGFSTQETVRAYRVLSTQSAVDAMGVEGVQGERRDDQGKAPAL